MGTTRTQSMDALQAANAVRTGRKELKRDLRIGKQDARKLLAEPPELIHTAQVGDFLRWVPWVGTVRARQIARRAGVSPSRSVGHLSARQRAEIAARLP